MLLKWGVKIGGIPHFQFVACDWPQATRNCYQGPVVRRPISALSCVQKHFLRQFSVLFLERPIINLSTKRIKTELLFKLSNLNSNLALTLGYLNPALNNSALKYKCIKSRQGKKINNKQNKTMRNTRMFGFFSYSGWLRPPTKTCEGFFDGFK